MNKNFTAQLEYVSSGRTFYTYRSTLIQKGEAFIATYIPWQNTVSFYTARHSDLMPIKFTAHTMEEAQDIISRFAKD